MHFARSPVRRLCEGGRSLSDFKFSTFIDRFPSDGAASMAVKGLKKKGGGGEEIFWIYSETVLLMICTQT